MGPHGIRSHGRPGVGLVSGIQLQQGAWSFGEFGLRRFTQGKWQAFGPKQWISELQWKGDSLYVHLPHGWEKAYWSGSSTSKFSPCSAGPAQVQSIPDIQWVQDVYGLAIESKDRSIGQGMVPALMIRSIERRTKKENDPIIIKVGFRGLPGAGAGIPIEYQINEGDWVGMGSSRRLVLE